MADINIVSWQQHLEESSSALNPGNLATNLYGCSIQIFDSLVKSPPPGSDSIVLQRLHTQAQKFKLWGSDLDARDGGLDERLSGAERLRVVLLDVLVRMGETLIMLAERLNREAGFEDVCSRFQLLKDLVSESSSKSRVYEDEQEIGVYPAISVDDLSSLGSDDSSVDGEVEVKELLQDLQSHNVCLYELGSVLQDPAEKVAMKVDGATQEQAVMTQSLTGMTAWHYISSVMETYPSIDRDFARRLGEANERRYDRLRQKREVFIDQTPNSENDSEEEAVDAPQMSQTIGRAFTDLGSSEASAPSTQMSSIFDKKEKLRVPKAPASLTSFASSTGNTSVQRRYRRVPKMPEDQPWGLPFRCTVCGEFLSNVWNPEQWRRHVYQDLQPYICSFSNCTSDRHTFVSRHEWAEHEFSEHRGKVTGPCAECGFQSSDAVLFQQHILETHTKLNATNLALNKSAYWASQTATNWIADEKCPFCLSSPASTRSQFVSHVAKHMQEVALAAVPISALTNDDVSINGSLSDSDDYEEKVSLKIMEQQPDNHPDLQDLLTWAEDVRQPGIGENGLEISRFFIPDPAIEAYFKTVRPIQKLLAALFPFEAPQVDPETIRKKYIKVFLILLLTGNGRFIASFLRHDNLSDLYLPFKSRPNHFPASTADPNFFTSFYHRQWEFCARIFEYAIHQQLDEDLIFPIIYKEKLGGGGSAVVHRIKLHPAYDKLSRQGHAQEVRKSSECPVFDVAHPEQSSIDQNAHTFVLKTYNTPDAERYYNNEVKGFLNLSNGGAHNASIVGFQGSFVWNGTYNVLLEYADRGTLAQFFDAIQPPSSGEDLFKLWRGIFRLLGALVAIHSVQPSDSSTSSDPSILQGYSSSPTPERGLAYVFRWHQDIKPSNILVKSKKGGSSYDCEFKLADLGLSHFKRHVPTQREAIDRDTYGTRAYGAPECYRADNKIEKLALLVKQGVDIWSLGCIFSEIAVWVVHGKKGLSEYRRRRGIETAQIHDFRDGDCFHNGEHVLATVTEIHRTLARDKRLCDHVTGATVEMVTKEMLIEPDSRTHAESLNYRTKGILRDAEIQLGRSEDTGSFCGTVAQSPPRTPPKPPPKQIQSRSSKSHGQRLPSHPYGGSPASTSYHMNEAHHLEPVDHFSRNGPPQQTVHSNRSIQRPSTGSATFPSFVQYDNPDQIPETHLDRGFFGLDLSQDSPSDPSRLNPSHTQRTRRWNPSDPFAGTDTRNSPERSSQDTQEIYNDGQRSSLTAARGGPSISSSTTLVQGSHSSSRAGPYRPNDASGTRTPGLELYVPLPEESQKRRRPPFLPLSVAQHWKGDRKQHKPVKLPNHDLLADLSGRDHVFLIDNTVSMRPYRKDVFDLFGLLGYMVKGTNPNGIQLRFTMSRGRSARARDTGPLLRNLDLAPFSGESNIRTQLGEILQDYHAKLRDQKHSRSLLGRARSPRPIRRQNVYVFTDGIWQPNCDPADLIEKLVNGLESYSMEREQFGIQFIRFGDNAEGINRLNQLDSGLGLSMDIVDTEPWNGNVWKMLLGPINSWFDDDVNANSVALASPFADTSP